MGLSAPFAKAPKFYGEWAFFGCVALTGFTISDRVSSIGRQVGVLEK